MKVLIDDKIPYLSSAVAALRAAGVTAIQLPASAMDRSAVHDADALIVRTRTRCDEALLSSSRVRLVVTATIGYDHIDTAWCEVNGIGWTNCPGCNASSVGQYVEEALRLADDAGIAEMAHSIVGIVGVGHVGTDVWQRLERRGMHVLLCDPPRAERGDIVAGHPFCTLAELAEECDVITFHVPLTRSGAHPTHHLADAAFFRSLRRRPLFLNTSRGPVADTDALVDALDAGQVRAAVVDVWEHEPQPDARLLQRAFLHTPHIAGYSANGKQRASQMTLDALCRTFPALPSLTADALPMHDEAPADGTSWLLRDSVALAAAPSDFEALRSHYPIRLETTF